MRRKWKKRKPFGSGVVHSFLFAQQTLHIALAALDLFDQPLQQAERESEQVLFADNVVRQVRAKLQQMQRSVSTGCLTTFDFNEKIILTAAISLYALDLLALPSNEIRTEQLRQCRQMVDYFADGLPKTITG